MNATEIFEARKIDWANLLLFSVRPWEVVTEEGRIIRRIYFNFRDKSKGYITKSNKPNYKIIVSSKSEKHQQKIMKWIADQWDDIPDFEVIWNKVNNL